jgi:hypothetical protein
MKTKIEKYIQDWENKCYLNGIPEDAPLRLLQLNKVPCYKKLCIAILNNDFNLKSLGLPPPKKSNYYHELKRIELNNRTTNKPKQLKLF